MKVSEIIIYNMKIMWRDFKRIRSSRFRNIQKSAKSSNFEWSCTYTGGQVRKRVSFQDRKNENTPKFPNIEIWCSAAFWRYLRIIWVIYTVFVKKSIRAIENLRFEIYFRFSRISTYRIFYFLRRLFAKHQTLSS